MPSYAVDGSRYLQARNENKRKAMLHNILRLQDVRVEDLMIPRGDIEAVEESLSLGELLKIFEESRQSTYKIP